MFATVCVRQCECGSVSACGALAFAVQLNSISGCLGAVCIFVHCKVSGSDCTMYCVYCSSMSHVSRAAILRGFNQQSCTCGVTLPPGRLRALVPPPPRPAVGSDPDGASPLGGLTACNMPGTRLCIVLFCLQSWGLPEPCVAPICFVAVRGVVGSVVLCTA